MVEETHPHPHLARHLFRFVPEIRRVPRGGLHRPHHDSAEAAVAAGVRRIEAVCGAAADQFINMQLEQLDKIKEQFNNPKDLIKTIENSVLENAELKKQLEHIENRVLIGIRNELLQKREIVNSVNFIGDIVEVNNADALKKLCFDLKNEIKNYLVVLCADIGGKSFVAISIAEEICSAKKMDAAKIIKEIVAPLIKGGGGGQKTLATGGGQEAGNLKEVINSVRRLIV